MKKYILMGGVLLFAFAMTLSSVFAAKPADNKAGAQKVDWNLSGDVMPVPPYGSADIAGSDTASKLIVNKPNGKVQAMVTGIMNGLHPNTTYTVYLSNSYSPFHKASVLGHWTWKVLGSYVHEIDIDSQNADGTFSGSGYYVGGGTSATETITGKITGNNIEFNTLYTGTYNPGYTATASGTIDADGHMSGISPWSWEATGAIKIKSGDTYWTGLLSETTPFTFMTDSEGSASWHYNFRFPVSSFSVWVNEGVTVLISDPISL